MSKSEQNFGPGRVLRNKREEYGWDVEEVAGALHLSKARVHSLEADNYDELPGSTYVIGYWRSYARLLEIDIEETIKTNRVNVEGRDSTDSTSIVPEERKLRSSAPTRLFFGMFLCLAALAAVLYFWGQGTFDKYLTTLTGTDGAATSEPAPEQVEPVLMPVKPAVEPSLVPLIKKPSTQTLPSPANQTESDTLLDLTAPQIDSLTSVATIGAVQQVATAAASNDALIADKPVVAIDPLVTPVNVIITKTAASETAAVSIAEVAKVEKETAEEAAQEPLDVDDPKQLSISLSNDSWLNVQDASLKRLVYGTERSGKKLLLNGSPPFTITAGVPAALNVVYMGKSVKVPGPKKGRSTSTFKVGS